MDSSLSIGKIFNWDTSKTHGLEGAYPRKFFIVPNWLVGKWRGEPIRTSLRIIEPPTDQLYPIYSPTGYFELGTDEDNRGRYWDYQRVGFMVNVDKMSSTVHTFGIEFDANEEKEGIFRITGRRAVIETKRGSNAILSCKQEMYTETLTKKNTDLLQKHTVIKTYDINGKPLSIEENTCFCSRSYYPGNMQYHNERGGLGGLSFDEFLKSTGQQDLIPGPYKQK